jgi:alpha-glucosidase (family GH31 glycosyl hydrolase)
MNLFLQTVRRVIFVFAFNFSSIIALNPPRKTDKLECLIENNDKLDCGFLGITKEECQLKGCCWNETHSQFPWCFSPKSSIECGFYEVQQVYLDKNSIVARLTYNSSKCSSLASIQENITQLEFIASFENDSQIRFQIADKDELSWKLPTELVPILNINTASFSTKQSILLVKRNSNSILISYGETTKLTLEIITARFAIKIFRNDKECLLDTTGSDNSLVFQSQYLKIGTWIPEEANIYGLGENVSSFRKDPSNSHITIFNQDSPTIPSVNLYGAHPFYLEHREYKSHGVFLRNSHGMDIIMKQKHIYFKVIGGIFDFFLFAGPTPDNVIEQFTNVIGKPFLIPYWSLGFHQCRYGYKSIDEVSEVVQKYAEHDLPLETMWLDIDYMNQYENFTIDPISFPMQKMKAFVEKLHAKGQKIIPIVDPGIKIKQGSLFYEEGIKRDLFIKNAKGSPFCGSVWPGFTHFPDFLHPETESYWENGLKSLHSQLQFDGLWLDMNEISSFCNGECSSDSEATTGREEIPKETLPSPKQHSPLKNPPYTINNSGLAAPLNTKTIDMDAVHYGPVLEYHIHNIYGYCEAKTTSKILKRLFHDKRPFLISRSTFSGSGAFTGHWTGDNFSDWDNLRSSIVSVLNFQLFGIPMVGSDICGFIGDADEELCVRWMQLGTFYPFSRNHNSLHSISQEPFRFPKAIPIFRRFLNLRYALLPYWYTLFAQQAHEQGIPVFRPLFFEYPEDKETFGIEKQFLIGPSLLVSPCLEQGITELHAYFPSGYWFPLDFEVYNFIDTHSRCCEGIKGAWIELPVGLSDLPIHLKGGTTIPMSSTGKGFLTTEQVRTSPIDLHIAISPQGFSCGTFYLDDGNTQAEDVKEKFISLTLDSQMHDFQLLIVKIDGHFGIKNAVKIKALQIYSSSLFEPENVFVQKHLVKCSIERPNVNLIRVSFEPIFLEETTFIILH